MRTLPPPDFSAPLPSRLVALWEQEGYITEDPTQKPSIGKRFFNGIKKVGVVIAVAGIGIVALGIKAELASRRNLQSEARPTTDRPGSFLPTHHQPVASTHITNVHQSAADQGNYVVDWGRLASQQRQVVADMERQAGLRHVERSRR
ncbi:MAG TPA: hypothetical protein VFA09_26125 [Ktedonobacteraceae bacterium]|nr:hypothetical protein [Ktedonobacteraceae bacterium]